MTESTATPAAFLEVANTIGSRLRRDALWDGGRCNWIGAAHEQVRDTFLPVVRTLGPDIYGGTAGIALFLARLHEETPEPAYWHTAAGAIEHALSRVDDLDPSMSHGFYSGLAGIAAALVWLGELGGREEWIEHGFRLHRENLRRPFTEARSLDLVSGAAGVLVALLDHSVAHDDDELLAGAAMLGDRLLDTARRSEHGWSWNTFGTPDDYGQPDLTGLSHGAAGIGAALLELATVTGEERFRNAAMEAFRYESSWYNAAAENWPDFRSSPGAKRSAESLQCSVAWCHGAPGIGLTRLRAFALTGEEAFRTQAEAALRTTVRALSGAPFAQQNFSLCHGLGGNADLLIEAALSLDSGESRAIAEQIGMAGMIRYATANIPWPSGLPNFAETPGLLLGNAGVGYFFLRLFAPDRVPSLLLTTPRQGTGAVAGCPASHAVAREP